MPETNSFHKSENNFFTSLGRPLIITFVLLSMSTVDRNWWSWSWDQNFGPISFGSKVIAKVEFFSKVGQSRRSRSRDQKFWY